MFHLAAVIPTGSSSFYVGSSTHSAIQGIGNTPSAAKENLERKIRTRLGENPTASVWLRLEKALKDCDGVVVNSDGVFRADSGAHISDVIFVWLNNQIRNPDNTFCTEPYAIGIHGFASVAKAESFIGAKLLLRECLDQARRAGKGEQRKCDGWISQIDSFELEDLRDGDIHVRRNVEWTSGTGERMRAKFQISIEGHALSAIGKTFAKAKSGLLDILKIECDNNADSRKPEFESFIKIVSTYEMMPIDEEQEAWVAEYKPLPRIHCRQLTPSGNWLIQFEGETELRGVSASVTQARDEFRSQLIEAEKVGKGPALVRLRRRVDRLDQFVLPATS